MISGPFDANHRPALLVMGLPELAAVRIASSGILAILMQIEVHKDSETEMRVPRNEA
jgi:hypothetical protein